MGTLHLHRRLTKTRGTRPPAAAEIGLLRFRLQIEDARDPGDQDIEADDDRGFQQRVRGEPRPPPASSRLVGGRSLPYPMSSSQARSGEVTRGERRPVARRPLADPDDLAGRKPASIRRARSTTSTTSPSTRSALSPPGSAKSSPWPASARTSRATCEGVRGAADTAAALERVAGVPRSPASPLHQTYSLANASAQATASLMLISSPAAVAPSNSWTSSSARKAAMS